MANSPWEVSPPAASGGGFPGRWLSGTFVGGPGIGSTSGSTLNRLNVVPLYLPKAISFDRVGINIAVLGAAGAVVRLGVYQNVSTQDVLFPDTLLDDFGTVPADVATGDQLIVINKTYGPGFIWIAGVSQVLVCSTGTLQGINLFGFTPFGVSTPIVQTAGYRIDAVPGALPNSPAWDKNNSLTTTMRPLLRVT